MGAWRVAISTFALLLGACTQPVVEEPGPAIERALDGKARTYVTTQQRAGARQPFLLLVPPRPVATVVLFPGGDGQIGLEESGAIGRGNNFLVRSRDLFVKEGVAAAVIAPPTDREEMIGFRTTQAHVLDIQGAIAYLREKLGVPVWLVGTSRGTLSAAYVASHLAGRAGPDGLVLTASVFVETRGVSVYSANLDAIRLPTLLVHHVRDACRVTPVRLADSLLSRLEHAPAKALITIDGGGPPKGDPCGAHHFHGFIGKEAETVRVITDWIKAHPTAGN